MRHELNSPSNYRWQNLIFQIDLLKGVHKTKKVPVHVQNIDFPSAPILFSQHTHNIHTTPQSLLAGHTLKLPQIANGAAEELW